MAGSMAIGEHQQLKQFLYEMLDRKNWTKESYERISEYIQNDAEQIQKLLTPEEISVITQTWVSFTNQLQIEEVERKKLEAPELIIPADLEPFHHHNKKNDCTGAYDYAIKQYIKEHIRMFVLGETPYIYRHGVYEADERGVWLKTIINRFIYPQFVRSTTTKRIYELFKMDSDLLKTADQLNQYPDHWVNFRNAFYDPIERKMIEHDSKYLSTYQIPHEYYPDQRPEGPSMKKWINFICPDPNDKEMLLQYGGYCMTKDTRQQKFLILTGSGGTGKSIVIRLIEYIVGDKNRSNISLSELQQRFSSYGLIGKLVNSCADLDIDALENTSMLKRILGEDSIRAEAKGQDAISFHSDAKLIFSTNELPIIKSERTNGFYRRLLVLNMNRMPAEHNTEFFELLTQDADYLIHSFMNALSRLYAVGNIAESENSIAAVERLRCDSDTVEAFIKECCTIQKELRIDRLNLYKEYEKFCQESERTALTKNSFYRACRSKGYKEQRTSSGRYFKGLSTGKSDTFFNESDTKNVTWTKAADNETPFD